MSSDLSGVEAAMFYYCLVETQVCHVPHLEWLPAETLEEARDHARRVLNQHRMPIAAYIYSDNERLDTVEP